MRNLFLLLLLIVAESTLAQKASDVLENSIRIRKGEKLILCLERDTLNYDTPKSLHNINDAVDFKYLSDSVIFLLSESTVNIYLSPLNPLNYTYNSTSRIVADPVNQAASDAFDIVLGQIKLLNNAPAEGLPNIKEENKLEFSALKAEIEKIKQDLQNDSVPLFIYLFKKLKAIDFRYQIPAEQAIDDVLKDIHILEERIQKHQLHISELQSNLKEFSKKADPITKEFLVESIISSLQKTLDEKKALLGTINKAYKIVDDARLTALKGGGQAGLIWCFPLSRSLVFNGRNSIFTVSISKGGYELSSENQLIPLTEKPIFTKIVYFRKFQTFVPELSVGTAFTFFKYNEWGTTTDTAGKQVVAEPEERELKNLNISTMLNFNFYIPNSSVHPFWQIGAGINSGIPTFLTGAGLRSNINNSRRLAISTGFAMTWLPRLKDLKVGQAVTGTDEIEKDIVKEFTWPPKPYIGLQYNF